MIFVNRLPRVLLAVATTIAAASIAPVPARAAVRPTPTTGTLTTAADGAMTGTVTFQAAGGIVINCRVAIDQPTYVPALGAVTGSARVLCNYFVRKIVLYVDLTRDGVELPESVSYDIQESTLSAGTTAATPCVPGTYFASALVNVTFPSGVVPPAAGELYTGDGLSINC